MVVKLRKRTPDESREYLMRHALICDRRELLETSEKIKRLVMALKNQEVVYLQRLSGYSVLMETIAEVSGYERMAHDEVLRAIGEMIEEVMGE
jgi:hypothetical protein